MDQCQYCREFHASHEVCDGFIDDVEKGDFNMTPQQQLDDKRMELCPDPPGTIKWLQGFRQLSPTWLIALDALKISREGHRSIQSSGDAGFWDLKDDIGYQTCDKAIKEMELFLSGGVNDSSQG